MNMAAMGIVLVNVASKHQLATIHGAQVRRASVKPTGEVCIVLVLRRIDVGNHCGKSFVNEVLALLIYREWREIPKSGRRMSFLEDMMVCGI